MPDVFITTVDRPLRRGRVNPGRNGWVLPRCRGFTLLEIMVALALLVVIFLAIGEAFTSAGTALRAGESTLEMTANVRAAQYQFAHDLHRLDTNGYLIIRSRIITLPDGTQGRADQLGFMVHETVTNPTGSYGTETGGGATTNGTLSDFLQSNSAAIWYGQLVLERHAGQGAGYCQGQKVPLGALPYPLTTNFPAAATTLHPTDYDFVLGRHVTLLVAPDSARANRVTMGGINDAAYSNILYNTPAVAPCMAEANFPADITSSRLAVADLTPQQVMEGIIVAMQVNDKLYPNDPEGLFIANNYCYRFGATINAYSSGLGIMNGYYRGTPEFLRGVDSFSVDWASATPDGELVWHGLPDASSIPAANPSIEPPLTPTSGLGDQYIATFDQSNRASWPAALKISYRVCDRHNLLPQGRTYTQVVTLPH